MCVDGVFFVSKRELILLQYHTDGEKTREDEGTEVEREEPGRRRGIIQYELEGEGKENDN